jgi:hypothetical protein
MAQTAGDARDPARRTAAQIQDIFVDHNPLLLNYLAAIVARSDLGSAQDMSAKRW